MGLETELTLSQLAGSAYRAFVNALAGLEVDLSLLFESEVWEQVVSPVLEIEDGSIAVSTLGEQLQRAYHLAAALPADEAVRPEPLLVIAWQAVACHLFALLQGMGDDVRELERSWAGWAIQRRQDATPTDPE